MPSTSPRTMQEIGRGAVFALAGRGTELLLALATQVLVARAVGASGFGVIVQCVALLYVLSVLCVFGFAETVSRFVPVYLAREDRASVRRLILLGLGVSFGAGLLVWAAVAFGARAGWLFARAPEVRMVLPVFVLALPCFAATQFLHGVLRGFGRAALKFTAYDLPVGLLRVAAVAAAVIGGWGLGGIAWGYSATFVAGAFALLWVLDRRVFPLGRPQAAAPGAPSGSPLRDLSGFVTGLLMLDVLWIGLEYLDVLCLAWFRPAAEVGLYRAGNQVARLLGMLISAVAYLYLPAVSHHFALGATERIRELYRASVRRVSWAGLLAALLVMVLAPSLTAVLYGGEFLPAGDVARLMVPGYLVHCLTGPNGSTLTALGRVDFSVRVAAVVIGVNLGLNLLLIPGWGMYGAAAAGMIALVLLSVLNQVGLHRFLGLPGQGAVYALQTAGVLVVIGVGVLMKLAAP